MVMRKILLALLLIPSLLLAQNTTNGRSYSVSATNGRTYSPSLTNGRSYSSGGGVPPAYVNSAAYSGTSSLDYTPVAGHSLLLPYSVGTGSDFSSIGADTGPICSGGAGSWVHVVSAQATATLGEFWGAWWCPVTTGNTGHVNYSGATSNYSSAFIEISGAHSFDNSNCTSGATQNMPGVVTSGPAFILLVAAATTASETFAGFTPRQTPGSHNFEYYESQTQTSPGTYPATGSPNNVDGCLIAWK